MTKKKNNKETKKQRNKEKELTKRTTTKNINYFSVIPARREPIVPHLQALCGAYQEWVPAFAEMTEKKK
jgi:hypothetical protein